MQSPFSRSCSWPIFLLLCLTTSRAEATCSQYLNWPVPCNSSSTYNTATLGLLEVQGGNGFAQFSPNLQAAVALMQQVGPIKSEDIEDQHVSVNYFCCYTAEEYELIIKAIEGVVWSPINLTFSQVPFRRFLVPTPQVICNVDNSSDVNSTRSFVVLADQQAELTALTLRTEQAIREAGLPVYCPREDQEPFHVTLGVVYPDYPCEEALQLISAQIPQFNTVPIELNNFMMFDPPGLFKAHQQTLQSS